MGRLLGLPLFLYGKGRTFVTDVISELRKVVWPTRREAMYLTTVVVIVSAAVGVVLGVADYVFAKVADFLVFR